jgi:GAF domain-containing protein
MARHEDWFLQEIADHLDNVIPHHALVVFVRQADTLSARFAAGSHADMLSNLELPLGKGLAGWVAQNATAVVNGNPAIDTDFACTPGQPLRSALVVPLEGPGGVVGVLALYHRERDAFAPEHLPLLQRANSRIAQAVERVIANDLALPALLPSHCLLADCGGGKGAAAS